MLLATINSGTLIIALPDLERSLHTSILELVWVILAYMIASTVLVLTAGRLSDLFGRKRVGIGSGMFNSPNMAAMMGTVPPNRRGVAAGARTMLQNTGAVISIAFVIAIVSAAVPKPVRFKIFSGLAQGLSDAKLEPFIHNMHTALWVLAATSLLGAGVSLLRPGDVHSGVRAPHPRAKEATP
jgi:MFS family permease